MDFKLRFREDQIRTWEEGYRRDLGEEDRVVECELGPKVWKRGFLTKEDLLRLCEWKSLRAVHHAKTNAEPYVQEVSRAALASSDERFRIEVLTLLSGVSWPMASVILHLVHEDRYPILDFRALWSLGFTEPPPYKFELWSAYTDFCRDLAQRNGISMRVLDRALWQYSKEGQVKPK